MALLQWGVVVARGTPEGARGGSRARVKHLTNILVFGSIGVNYLAATGWLLSGDPRFQAFLAPSLSELAFVAALDVGVWAYYDGRRHWKRRPPIRAVAEPRYIAPVVYGVAYAWLESTYISNFVSTSSAEYRVLYLAAMSLPFYTRNFPLWVADALVAVTAEDLGFWAFRVWLPDQWAWYYPTIFHIPVLDVLAIAVIPVLYWWVQARGSKPIRAFWGTKSGRTSAAGTA
jgi:hypothetical protein